MSNPLANFYRIPGIHQMLPTRGQYNKNIDESMTGEIPIYPLSTADELIVTNPDCLLNGSAIEQIIKSCTPSIKDNPRSIAIADIDVIMMATKMITYGDDLKLESTCPKCNTHNEFVVSINTLLSNIKFFPEKNTIKFGNGLTFYLKPYDLEASTKIQLAEFSESNLIKSLSNTKLDIAERSKLIQPSLEKMVHTLVDVMADGIQKIIIDETGEEISNRKDIVDFVRNAPANITSAIQKKQEDFKNYGLQQTTKIKCKNEDCGHEWETKIMYDPSNFFASDS